jgi:hypothetical protein
VYKISELYFEPAGSGSLRKLKKAPTLEVLDESVGLMYSSEILHMALSTPELPFKLWIRVPEQH